ncbi:MAG TPA: hypothetical protein VIA62_17645 [Thermoanaerobaculia bacterium]|nr:hypothetical protein [Thermoanaerobaculia bacterium]
MKMKKLPMLLAALWVALVAATSAAPKSSHGVAPKILCPNCPPGWVSTGPPLCRCIRGNN